MYRARQNVKRDPGQGSKDRHRLVRRKLVARRTRMFRSGQKGVWVAGNEIWVLVALLESRSSEAGSLFAIK